MALGSYLRTGVYPITEQYAAECGYTVSVFPQPVHVELRASYFSCHTDNKDDEVFTFNFNLVTTHDGQKETYALNKTCSPSLPWSPKEATCEVNYMEVSVKSDVTCPSGTKDDWGTLKLAHSSTTSDWQVMFQIEGEQLLPRNLSEARKQGYVFDLTDGRLVFRAPYRQPDSYSTMMNGVPVEVVYATLFSRQSWVVLMVELVATCSMHKGLYDDSGYMVWGIPESPCPSFYNTNVSIGLNSELLEQSAAEERGYIMETHNSTIHISIPYNADGVYRKSFVTGDLNEFYMFNLYLEQILVDDDNMEARLRYHRTLTTPLLPRPVFTNNRTVVEERMFTVYLGDVPDDVELVAVQLNGHDFALPFTNTSTYTISKVVQPNNTHSYTLKVPFDDPVVIQQFSKEDAAMQHQLTINYTLTVQPENDPYYHFTSVTALTDVSPPTFNAVCSESGISFRLDHQPSDYLWDISIGSDLLTPELAEQRGYIMSNDSQSLLLKVPLFTEGYEYKDFTLKGFFGTFAILVRDHETSEVQSSAVKTCPFTTTELIVCSTDGRMTVVADLSLVVPSGGIPARVNLIDKYCGPKEVNGTRALFSFPLNTCGSRVTLDKENVTYQNEIFYSNMSKQVSDNATESVIIQCTYPLAGLHRLFKVYRFESDMAGIGHIHNTHSTEGLQRPTIKPTAAVETTSATTRPFIMQPASHSPAHYIKVYGVYNSPFGFRRVLPITPAELFYSDPTMHCGRRIPNTVSEFRAFDCFQLNTPPPVMSTCVSPPNRPDPFRSERHSIRDLGSSTLRAQIIHSTTQPRITNLLKLHHHEPLQRDESLTALNVDSSGGEEPLEYNRDSSSGCGHPDSNSAEESEKFFYSDVEHPRAAGFVSELQKERCWSDTELEAADTLLSHFSLMEEDGLEIQTQQGSEASPVLIPAAHSATNHTGYVSSSCVKEDGGWMEFMSVESRNTDQLHEEYQPSLLVKSRSSVFRQLSGVKGGKLTESEGDALHVLLSLGDV
ncbi:uncharacterized protein LOC134005542 [Scomber scombrus]|uniref:uncharacterized protein LOC134005542 n=1 Tax=Scomber scombrus TaxID=13677 RepID=UPI002DDC3FCE|nr:uncharacterized protein LOC134005542 [Scomber scombrus]